jgi:penicillin-insensitive murein endopeptidase
VRAERALALAIAALVGLTWVGCAQHPAPRAVPDVQAPGSASRAAPNGAAGAGSDDGVTALAEAGASAEDTRADELDDSGELDESASTAAPSEAQSVRPHPLDGWSNARISAAIRDDLPSLGSMSLGSANAGGLINGVQAAPNALYAPVSPSGAWGTQETLDYLSAALQRVHEQFPDTPPLALGDISGRRGGASPPHVSHQSGRDVDIAYFYNDGARWYARGTAKNLDLPRNWAFVRALLTETDVDLILIDHSIQVLLEQYALEQGEDRAWLSGVFRGAPGQLRPIIRHAPGHATHIHIRFFNPTAQETARRCHSLLIEAKLTSAPQRYLSHKVKKNETLGMISRKYGVSVARLRSVNGLKSNLIREKSTVRVPIASRGPEPTTARVRIPARRLPPPRHPDRGATSQLAPPQPPPTR